jgi:DNA mismatch repair protein MutS
MVEMIEVAHILRRASDRSLVLLDEIGRGTSTFDGLAIAWAVTEDVAKRVGCRCLFATHYHQLIGLEAEMDGLVNVHVQVAQRGDELKFLYTIADGPCDDSYGVQVAALAGLPAHVVERARDLLLFLEAQAEGARAGEDGTPLSREVGQSSLFGWMLPKGAGAAPSTEEDATPQQPVDNRPRLEATEAAALARLQEVDPDTLSPREAMDLLYELRGLLRGQHEWLEE